MICNEKQTHSTLVVARQLVAAGISVVPAGADKLPVARMLPAIEDELDPSKRKRTWKPLQERLPTEDELVEWFSKGHATPARIHGPISGNLECIDFDTTEDAIFNQWRAVVEEHTPGLIDRLTLIRTPRGGLHVVYRCSGPVDGNQKLAQQRENGSEKLVTIIETRGTGGYALCPGGPDGFPQYAHIAGPALTAPATITAGERQALLSAARLFDESEPAAPLAVNGAKPGEDYNERADWRDILEPAGLRPLFQKDGATYWYREGSQNRWAATTGYGGRDLLHIFSPNCRLPANRSMTKFTAFAYLHHRGDFSAAARALVSNGHGQRKSAPEARAVQGNNNGSAGPAFVSRNGATIQPKEVKWLWPGRIPAGKLTIFSANPGVGKTFMSCDIAARITTGALWPDMVGKAPVGTVAFLNSEDDADDTLIPRLLAAGADVYRTEFIDAVSDRDAKDNHLSRAVRFDTDLGATREFLRAHPDVRVLIVDPLTSYLGKADSHKNAEVRAVLGPLCQLASEHDLTIIGISHFNKGKEGAAITKTSGSMAFVAQARSVWTHIPDADDPDRILWLPVKMNLCQKPPGLAYRLANNRVEWELGEVNLTADEAVNAQTSGPKRDRVAEAAAWLKQELAGGEWAKSAEIEAKLEDAKISLSTYKRAKKKIGVESWKSRGKDAPWFMRLQQEDQLSPAGTLETLGTVETLGTLCGGEESQEAQQFRQFQGDQEYEFPDFGDS
jgi:hypothetical protein